MESVPAEFAPTTAERIARNDDTFRSANEKIRESAERYGFADPVPFLCECADPTCSELLRVDLSTYADVRAHPRWFIKAPGHEAADGRFAEVVSTEDGFVIAEKVGAAGEIAERLDGGGEP